MSALVCGQIIQDSIIKMFLDYDYYYGYIITVTMISPDIGENMEKQNYSIAEAKTRLPSIVHEVEEGPSVRLTRHGKPVAVLMSIREYEQMRQKQGNFWNSLLSFRKTLANEGVEISDADLSGLRDLSPGREVESFK